MSKKSHHHHFTILAAVLSVVSVTAVFLTIFAPLAAHAAHCGGVETSIIDCSDGESDGGGIYAILKIILDVLTYGVGIAGTLGIVISGVQYLTARDNEQQVAKAKSRLINILIGLVAYALMWAFLQWILPGGIIGN